MKRYQSHKVVEAAKIIEIQPDPVQGSVLHLEDFEAAVAVSGAWMTKHEPEVGGYYVRYPDGYESYSPAKSFLDGYHVVQ